MDLGGIYYNLYQSQFKDFIQDESERTLSELA